MWMTTTWNAKYYSNIYSKSSQSFCDEYNGMIIKVFNIYTIELHKSKGISNILEYP